MSSFPATFWIFSITFALFALYFLAIGLRVMLATKPFLLPARQLYGVFLLVFVPVIILQAQVFLRTRSTSFRFMPVFQILMTAVLVAILWRQLKGYLALGVTEDSFRAA